MRSAKSVAWIRLNVADVNEAFFFPRAWSGAPEGRVPLAVKPTAYPWLRRLLA